MMLFTFDSKYNVDNQHIISESKAGVIYKCDDCCCFNIVYKNVCINLDLETYPQFYTVLLSAYQRFILSDKESEKLIKISTPYAGLTLFLPEKKWRIYLT